MGETDDFAIEESLRGVFADRAAALKEQDFFPFAGKFYGERDAGSSCTRDADICREASLRSFVEEIVNHGRPARAGSVEMPALLRVDRMDWIRSMISPTCLSLW